MESAPGGGEDNLIPNTAIWHAAQTGSVTELDQLLAQIADRLSAEQCRLALVNAAKADDLDTRALHMACGGGHLDMVVALLRHKADIKVITKDGRTPLFIAAKGGELEIVRVLLDKGATAQTRPDPNFDYTVLHHAVDTAKWRYNSASLLHLLVQKNAELEAVTANGLTAMHVAAING